MPELCVSTYLEGESLTYFRAKPGERLTQAALSAFLYLVEEYLLIS